MIDIVSFTDPAWEDYIYWQNQDKKTLKRINKIIENTKRTPFEGLGKPESLRANLSGLWSRRIDEKKRIVYSIDDEQITIIACKGHYE